MRLDPFHPHFAPLIAGIAYYLRKEYQEAQRWLREATGRAPNHQYGQDARAEAAEVLRVNPQYTIGTQKQVSILKRFEDSDHLIDGLRKAGLPE
jgi:adenylate cyclase